MNELKEPEFVTVHKQEAWGWGGEPSYFGLEIRVAGLEITDEMKRAVRNYGDDIAKELRRLYAVNDPAGIEIKAEWRRDLIACFPENERIYVKEIPNGYCSDACCINRPWLCVTTPRGPITIGPRKRIIEIDWGNSDVKQTGEQLFPNEETTRLKSIVHAWGLEKAKEYIATILNAPEVGP